MDRAAIGLGSVFLHLGAELNWYKIFNELIAGFNEKEVEKNRINLLRKLNWEKGFNFFFLLALIVLIVYQVQPS